MAEKVCWRAPKTCALERAPTWPLLAMPLPVTIF